jgi:hypothetical protein
MSATNEHLHVEFDEADEPETPVVQAVVEEDDEATPLDASAEVTSTRRRA